jgi:hypothetical protein
MTAIAHPELEGLDRYKFGWADSDVAGASARRGLSEEVVRDISALKDEPGWMLELRLKGLKLFGRKPMPDWGADLTGIDFENIKYFVRSTEKQAASWDAARGPRSGTSSNSNLNASAVVMFDHHGSTPLGLANSPSTGDTESVLYGGPGLRIEGAVDGGPGDVGEAKVAVAGVGPQPGEGLGQIDAGAF